MLEFAQLKNQSCEFNTVALMEYTWTVPGNLSHGGPYRLRLSTEGPVSERCSAAFNISEAETENWMFWVGDLGTAVSWRPCPATCLFFLLLLAMTAGKAIQLWKKRSETRCHEERYKGEYSPAGKV